MMSYKYKCIFIHIPKSAGTSIEQTLGHFKQLKRGVQDHRTIREMEPMPFVDLAGLILKVIFHYHATILKK